MQLLLIRHAIAEDRFEFARSGQSDYYRPLTDRGRARMAKGAAGLRTLVPDIDVLATSPLTRAVREGAICYLDEVVEARKDTTVLIHALTDHRRLLPIDKTGELLPADRHLHGIRFLHHDRILFLSVIALFEFIPVQKLHFYTAVLPEIFPGRFLPECAVGQTA